MVEAISGLNRNTIARDNGMTPSNKSIDYFAKLIFDIQSKRLENGAIKEDSFINSLEHITSFDGISIETKNMAIAKRDEVYLSKSNPINEATKVM